MKTIIDKDGTFTLDDFDLSEISLEDLKAGYKKLRLEIKNENINN